MHVLIIGINYRPELTGIGPYTTGLAEHLAMRGDQVTVIAGLPHYPDWRLAKGTPRTLVREETIAGVRVIRAAHFVPSRQDAVRRGLYEATFGATALMDRCSATRPQAIIGIIPSLSGGVLARLMGRRYGAPYGLVFQDLMGPAAKQSGMIGGAIVSRATSAAERWACADARAIGVVSTSFEPYLRSIGVPSDRIMHVPNWSRPIQAELPAETVRARFGWNRGEQIALHAGNIGLKQGLEQVIEAARLADERGDPVRFVFSGDGNQAAAIRAAADGLGNVQFLGVQSDGMHASLLAAADVLLLSERPTQIDMSLPSKLTAYHAAGRPVIAAVPPGGASSAEVARSASGIVVPAGAPEALLDALSRLRDDPALARHLAQQDRLYAERHTSAQACLELGAALVDRIAGGRSRHA